MTQYILLIAAIVCGIIIIKKVAGCLIRTVVFLLMLAVVAYAYCYFTGKNPLERFSIHTEETVPANETAI